MFKRYTVLAVVLCATTAIAATSAETVNSATVNMIDNLTMYSQGKVLTANKDLYLSQILDDPEQPKPARYHVVDDPDDHTRSR